MYRGHHGFPGGLSLGDVNCGDRYAKSDNEQGAHVLAGTTEPGTVTRLN